MTRALLRILKYAIVYPLVIVYMAHSLPVTYKHDREMFLAQMHRVYEKQQARQDDAAFALLGKRKIPAMPVKGL